MALDETQSLLGQSDSHETNEHGIRDFGSSLPPDETRDTTHPRLPPRLLTFTNGVALVVGIQVGSGIFSSPSIIFTNVGSPGLALLVWILAGLIAWTGAASFIQLGELVPLSGGVQEYLRYCYNNACGCVAAWMFIFIIKPCSTSMLSLTFAEYLIRAFIIQYMPSIWILRATAMLAVIFITYLNCIGTRIVGNTANLFLVLKLAGLGSIIIIGLVQGVKQYVETDKRQGDVGQKSNYIHLNTIEETGTFTDAMLAASWAYSGWETLGFVSEELQDPTRNLSRVLHSSMATVILLFVLANTAYFVVIPQDVLRKGNAIALDFGRIVFGPIGTSIYAWVVCLSCLGGLTSKIFTASRLTEVAIKRRYLPFFLTPTIPIPGRQNMNRFEDTRPQSGWKKFLRSFGINKNAPIVPLLLNLSLTSIYLLFGSFPTLLVFVGIAESITIFAAVSGLLTLYYRGTSTPSVRIRALSPLVYCFCTTLVVMISVTKHPVQGVTILIFLSLCTAAYFVNMGYEAFNIS